jgi:menaquinone-dependent protoporphyrinogen IX oxidase
MTATMRAAVFVEQGAILLREVARPKPGPGETLVKVTLTTVASYGAIDVVSPVYVSKHPRSIASFVRAHARNLSRCARSAFFSVSNSAASRDPALRRQARTLAEALPAKHGWRPQVVAIAGGALAYPRYGLLTRFLMKRIARANGGPTDTRQVHELTDWRQLDDDVAALVGPLEPRETPATDVARSRGRNCVVATPSTPAADA